MAQIYCISIRDVSNRQPRASAIEELKCFFLEEAASYKIVKVKLAG